MILLIDLTLCNASCVKKKILRQALVFYITVLFHFLFLYGVFIELVVTITIFIRFEVIWVSSSDVTLLSNGCHIIHSQSLAQKTDTISSI